MKLDPASLPPVWWVLPFIFFLVLLATGPVIYPHWWEKSYVWIAPALAFLVSGYYLFAGHACVVRHTIIEYIQFILPISVLYIIAGNIAIRFHQRPTTQHNLLVLWGGAILANLIGTTGASMLLIRPYMKMNKKRLAAYHVVFFIFMVSNVGGVLTPVGDPPLLMGFFKGVPFGWMLRHSLMAWLIALICLSLVFIWLDRHNGYNRQSKRRLVSSPAPVEIQGWAYFAFFGIVMGTFILDLKPGVRELVLVLLLGVLHRWPNTRALVTNGFSLAPIKEVALIFIGIFGTMMPALAWTRYYAMQHAARLTPNFLYWSTGVLSSILDNAPTYLNFLAASVTAHGLEVENPVDVIKYSADHPDALLAISLAAVFFGAMTYIGNGPNFMVRTIAEEQGLAMPGFLSYIRYFSLPYLLPALVSVWYCVVFLHD